MNEKKIILYSLLSVLLGTGIYLYFWEKPKLEHFILTQIIEPEANAQIAPTKIRIEKLNISFIPLQIELYKVKVTPSGKLRNTIKDFEVDKIIGRPSIIDLIVGKPWASLLSIEGSSINLNIKKTKTASNGKSSSEPINFNSILRKIPLSQLRIKDVQLNINYNDEWYVSTESLYVRAYNEKSSLILTVKDPNINIKNDKSKEPLNILADFQVMVTSNTLSISSIKIVKENSFFVASGNLIFDGTPENYKEINIKTRIRSEFENINRWSNQLYPNKSLEKIEGEVKGDIQIVKGPKDKDIKFETEIDLKKLKIGKLFLGDLNIVANAPNQKQINIPSIKANLVGNNLVEIKDAKVHIDGVTEIKADVSLQNTQLHSFLRDSGIADIPVWLNINGNISCNGKYDKKLKINCPGALTVKNLKIKTKSRTKSIVQAKHIDIAGQMTITEKNISYKAKAKLKETQGSSDGVIDFDKGFDINYQTNNLNFTEVGPISDLKFVGLAELSGSTKGDSRAATFQMDVKSKDFEFENYFFGDLNSKLRYKSGTLFFENLSGSLESTRYKGNLNVNLLKEHITGDLQLPFFRMVDIQQSVLKKVDLKNRFLGSGSGRIKIDTPFVVDRMGFQLEARLFKGTAFGEEYNEAKVKAEAVEGIIIIQQAKLQKEETEFLLKGTLDTKLSSKMQFSINSGFLQLSTILKNYNLPVSGEFSATGDISGNLANPTIKTNSQIKNLIFNKYKYGDALFSYDNSNKQTNLQFSIPKQLEFLVILPESNYDSFFIDMNSEKLDIAPIIGYLVSEDSTRSYVIETSGEISGNFDTKYWWNSEFSSTIKDIRLDYKSNIIKTESVTNIEMKNARLFLNEIHMQGNKQYVKITQPYTERYKTKFVINSRMNIAFFKLFAPFFEKIDGTSNLRLELAIQEEKFKIYGSSYTSNGFIKFPGFPHPIEDVKADILFNQNKVSINSISGTMAEGKVLGNGEINFPAPGKFNILISTNIENTNVNFPEGFKTRGSGSVTLSGDKPPFLLSGNYNVKGGLIESNFQSGDTDNSSDLLEELLKKEISSPLKLNFTINTDKPVEVRNSLVEGFIIGNMRVFDKINTPRIEGEAHFDRDSVVKFKDQEFEVTNSNFIFEGQSPINPRLSLRSKTRMNDYDIDLSLSGRAANPILTMSSQPPLPETQIISMLALGQIPDQFDQQNNNNSFNNNNQNQGFEVGTSLIGNNPLAREIKKRSGIDIDISSSFDENTGAAAPRVNMRYKITKKLEASANSTTGGANQYEGRVTYELSNEWSSIFRVTSPNNTTNSNNNNNNNTTTQNNPFGLDLEYKVEFD